MRAQPNPLEPEKTPRCKGRRCFWRTTAVVAACLFMWVACTEPAENEPVPVAADVPLKSVLDTVPQEARAGVEKALREQLDGLSPRFRTPSKLTFPMLTGKQLLAAFRDPPAGWRVSDQGSQEIRSDAVQVNRAYRVLSKDEAEVRIELVDAKDSPLFLLNSQRVLGEADDTEWKEDVASLKMSDPAAQLGTFLAVVDNRFSISVMATHVEEEELASVFEAVDVAKLKNVAQ
ncbi:MAG: hypothetical protein C4523_12745 [Myxococcales bacterium]|nr:MAG: hypothetical protein C4523_12745 [Myxococcales bacterium]